MWLLTEMLDVQMLCNFLDMKIIISISFLIDSSMHVLMSVVTNGLFFW